MMELHDFDDIEYWAARFSDCSPYTYPPELFTYATRQHLVRPGFLWIKPRYGYHDKAVCARCGDDIMTGHTCPDISAFFRQQMTVAITQQKR